MGTRLHACDLEMTLLLFVKEVMHVLTQALWRSFNAVILQIKVMLSLSVIFLKGKLWELYQFHYLGIFNNTDI